VTLPLLELAATTAKKSGSSPILLLLVVLGGGYFFIMRRQAARRRAAQDGAAGALEPGSRVLLRSGLYATLVRTEGDDLIVEPSPGVEQRYHKQALLRVIPEPEPDEDVAAPSEHPDPLEQAYEAPSATREEPVVPPAPPAVAAADDEAPHAAEPPAPPSAPSPPANPQDG